MSLITRLRAWWNRDDPAWRPTGLKFTTGRDYVGDRASAMYQRSRHHTATGRAYKGKRKPHTATPDNVVTFRKGAK